MITKLTLLVKVIYEGVVAAGKRQNTEAATGGVLQKTCSQKFCNIHRKTPVSESLF